MGICRKCAAGTVAFAAGVVPIFCNHRQGDDDLPESEIHGALMQPVVRAITTSAALAGISGGVSTWTGNLTVATSASLS
jgi:hypothetical protein